MTTTCSFCVTVTINSDGNVTLTLATPVTSGTQIEQQLISQEMTSVTPTTFATSDDPNYDQTYGECNASYCYTVTYADGSTVTVKWMEDDDSPLDPPFQYDPGGGGPAGPNDPYQQPCAAWG
jgi:hypothetical protein